MATLLTDLIARTRIKIREALALLTPGAPLVAPQGTTGATAYSYVIVATNATGSSNGSQAGQTSAGNATLSGTNFNQLNWTLVPRATGYKIYRTVGGATQGLIGTTTTALTFNDTGIVGDGSTAPTTNTSGTLGTSQYWSDFELMQDLLSGCKDLWRKHVDLHQGHFTIIDTADVATAANSSTLTGVPADCFRILLIEPVDTTDAGTFPFLKFRPSQIQSQEFRMKRTQTTLEATQGGTILYDIINAGSPVMAPSIIIAPQVDSVVPLRFIYVQTLSSTLGQSPTDVNPIPGESDMALVAWTTAYALSKDREDRSPDPNWIAIYSTEAKAICTVDEPRQEQEPPVVAGIFDDLYDIEF